MEAVVPFEDAEFSEMQSALKKKKNYTSDTLSWVPRISGDFLALLCLHSLTSYLWSKGDTPSSPQKSDAENK